MLVLATALGLALVLGLGVYLGLRGAYRSLGIDPGEYRQMRVALPEARARVAELERELDASRTRHEVDRAALEMLRQDLARQRQQIADLDEGLRFYRSLMAPGEIAQGVSLRGVELVAREPAGRFGYRLVVQQEARKHETVRGELRVSLQGELDGQPASFALSRLADDVEGATIDLRFRYFQAVEGELQLPEGFAPAAVEVVAELSSPRTLSLSERYPWLLQEKFTHVGK